MEQPGFFDGDERLKALSAAGDPLGEGLLDTRSLNGRYVEQIWATCFPITRTSQDARPFLTRANNIALTGIDSVEYRRHVASCVP